MVKHNIPQSPESVVRGFFRDVRSGSAPGDSAHYLASCVSAHQVTSEGEATVMRTAEDYAAHVREFLAMFGRFTLRIEELIAQGDRVYVRWRQEGRHLGSVNGEQPTGGGVTDIASAVYRIEEGRIVEYWLQADRKGLELQLDRLGHERYSSLCDGREGSPVETELVLKTAPASQRDLDGA